MPDADAVYREYRALIYGYLFRLCRDSGLAEELTQETFYQAVKQWIKDGCPGMEGVDLPVRIAPVDDLCRVSVGIVQHRPPAVLSASTRFPISSFSAAAPLMPWN